MITRIFFPNSAHYSPHWKKNEYGLHPVQNWWDYTIPLLNSVYTQKYSVYKNDNVKLTQPFIGYTLKCKFHWKCNDMIQKSPRSTKLNAFSTLTSTTLDETYTQTLSITFIMAAFLDAIAVGLIPYLNWDQPDPSTWCIKWVDCKYGILNCWIILGAPNLYSNEVFAVYLSSYPTLADMCLYIVQCCLFPCPPSQVDAR